MKKKRLIAALAALFIAHSVSIAAEPERQSQAARGQETVSKKWTEGRKKALNQWNESLNRIKRCIKGKCTRAEALKAARDLGIAAVATITALYAGKTVLKRLVHRDKIQLGAFPFRLFLETIPGLKRSDIERRLPEFTQKASQKKWFISDIDQETFEYSAEEVTILNSFIRNNNLYVTVQFADGRIQAEKADLVQTKPATDFMEWRVIPSFQSDYYHWLKKQFKQ